MAIERIVDTPANAAPGTPAPAQEVGVPMAYLGIGAIVLGAVLNKPALTTAGVVAALTGTGLIVFSNRRMPSPSPKPLRPPEAWRDRAAPYTPAAQSPYTPAVHSWGAGEDMRGVPSLPAPPGYVGAQYVVYLVGSTSPFLNVHTSPSESAPRAGMLAAAERVTQVAQDDVGVWKAVAGESVQGWVDKRYLVLVSPLASSSSTGE